MMTYNQLSPQQLELHRKLQTDTPFFIENVLKIKSKSGDIIPFKLNKAQKYIHEQLEKQLHTQGCVRALIIKGRQQGASTYISARFYHKVTRKRGKNVFILSHEAQTTEKLFDMVDTFQKHSPPALKPATDTHNRRKLSFSQLDSTYNVGTAGNEDVGRGGTLQYFHGSEVAFWEKTDGIETGIMQSVAYLPDTEMILESTANGMSGMFFEKISSALEGLGDYIVIFTPWFWSDEYRRPVPADFSPTTHEQDLMTLHDLDGQQIYWRRKKIEDFKSEWKFKQEYPCTIMEAFITSGNGFFDIEKVEAAMARKIDIPSTAPKIGAMDPAGRTGKDSVGVGIRQGNQLTYLDELTKDDKDPMFLVHQVDMLIKKHNIDKFFIDNGYGEAIVSRLWELDKRYKSIVQGVWFSEKTLYPDKYTNKRSEMFGLLREWIAGEDGSPVLPDNKTLLQEMSAIPKERYNSNGKMALPSKDDIKKLLHFSTNLLDTVALTFAYPVAKRHNENVVRKATGDIRKMGQSPLSTIRNLKKSASRSSLSSKISLL